MIRLSLAQPDHSFHLPLAGTYRLYLTGGFSVSGLEHFGIQLTQSDTTKVILAEPLAFKQRVRLNGKRAVACFQIHFPETGAYQLSFRNAEKISLKRSVLVSLNFLFPKEIPYDQVEVILELKR
jgi:hypothetical protein